MICDAVNHLRANVAHRLVSVRFLEFFAIFTPFPPEVSEQVIFQSELVVTFLPTQIAFEFWLSVPDHVMIEKYSAGESLETFTAGEFRDPFAVFEVALDHMVVPLDFSLEAFVWTQVAVVFQFCFGL